MLWIQLADFCAWFCLKICSFKSLSVGNLANKNTIKLYTIYCTCEHSFRWNVIVNLEHKNLWGGKFKSSDFTSPKFTSFSIRFSLLVNPWKVQGKSQRI